jgi:N utilization substance protein B
LTAGSRRRGREAALQILFQMEMSGASAADAAARFWEHLVEDDAACASARSFADHLVQAVLKRRDEIDASIREVSEHWRLERMSMVDRNVLRVALAELLEDPSRPRAVILDEAIEIAKRFGGEESGQFVNGVLDALRSRLEGEAARDGDER